MAPTIAITQDDVIEENAPIAPLGLLEAEVVPPEAVPVPEALAEPVPVLVVALELRPFSRWRGENGKRDSLGECTEVLELEPCRIEGAGILDQI